jgi:predicted nucleotidyltransferase
MSGSRKKIVRERLADCDLEEHVDCFAQRSSAAPPRWYRGADVPMSVIRRFARQVVERFQPEKIILFGSYAYGAPHADSDVDILVVMPARNQIDQAVRIDAAIDAPFPLDLIVRTPENLNWRLKEGDSFLREIVTRGKVLYEKNDARVGAKGRGRLSSRRTTRHGQRSVP